MLPQRKTYYVILAAGALACDAERLTHPMRFVPTAELIAPPSGSHTLSPTTSVEELPPDTVVYYPESTLVRVRAEGLLDVFRSDAEGWGSTAGTYVGQLDAGGYRTGDLSLYANVAVEFSASGFAAFADNGPGEPPVETWTVYRVVKGYGTVRRNRGPVSAETFCDGPGEPVCHTLTGSIAVTIAAEQADFAVTASPTTVNYPDTVTVTATVTPGQVAGVTMPLKLDSVTWAPAFGTQASPCLPQHFVVTAPGTLACRKPFTRSGTLTVYATVQGAKRQQSVPITVTPPVLTVTANPTVIGSAQSVTFTAAVTPASVGWNVWTWTWRPDSGDGGISPSGCFWTEKVCSRTITKSGWNTAEVRLGAGEYTLHDSVHVVVGEAAVRFQTMSGGFEVRPAGTGGATTLQVAVSVVGSDGVPIPNRVVNLTLDGIEQSGGHAHGGTMPPGGLDPSSVTTDSTGHAAFVYTAGVFGGTVALRGASEGAASAVQAITVRVPGLVQLLEAGSVDTIGVTTTHPSNHWATPEMRSALMALADEFLVHATSTGSSQKLQINDLSVTMGGKFDLGNAYDEGGKHSQHRVGTNADVRIIGLTPGQLRVLRDVWEDLGGSVVVEDSPPHYHLKR